MKVKGPRKLRKRVRFAAQLLGVEADQVTVRWSEDGSSMQTHGDSCYTINVQADLKKKCFKPYWMQHIAHEVVHIGQYARGELQYGPTGQFVWKGTPYKEFEEYSNEYWLAPWELEARSLEDWVMDRWEKR